jgi:sec-independent protein translocase protein TatC
MAEEPELERPLVEEDEDGGGPVKTFLEHLEDLRWTLIKLFSAVLISMVVCLVAGNYLVTVLRYPLNRAGLLFASPTNSPLTIFWGTNLLAEVKRESLTGYPPALNSNVHALLVVPRLVGSNDVVLSLTPAPPGTRTGLGGIPLKTYSPMSGPMVAIKLAIYGGLVLALPFILYFIGEFVLPALKVREKRFVLRATAVGGGLFVAGVVFCYFVMLPIALAAAAEFSRWLGFAADEWRAEDFIAFECLLLLVTGLSFELPIPILALVRIGILDYKKLSAMRPYWVVAELALCAVVTPTADPFTMVLLALPLHGLYEISVIIAWFWARADRRREAALALRGVEES